MWAAFYSAGASATAGPRDARVAKNVITLAIREQAARK
jgi:hypothetical protein